MKRLILFAAALLCVSAASAQGEYNFRKRSLFDVLPIRANDIVFLGNSITDGGEFNELFGMDNIKNRGIRSDAIPGVEKRLGQVTSGGRKKISTTRSDDTRASSEGRRPSAPSTTASVR